MIHEKSYNERLFKGGIRKWLHEARFIWLGQIFQKYNLNSSCVAELGCFDGRALQYIPKPTLYFGFDADWEGGLECAQNTYADNSNYVFKKCLTPDGFECDGEIMSCAISLETLEHIPVELIEGYIQKIFNIMMPGGYFIVSVPNEKGLIFFLKHLIKLIFLEGGEKYTLSEFLWASIGRLDKVERYDHKGFDWYVLQQQLERSFVLIEKTGLQIRLIPPSLNASIGMVFQKTNKS
jgi:hypothetical protein